MFSLILRDLNTDVVAAWRTAFADISGVDIAAGSILEASADAIISPANSFGYMDGGVDLAYCRFFGFELQDRLQAHLHEHHFGELPVGSAVVIETRNPKIPYLISAPTMRVPSSVRRSINVYLAFRAALISAVKHNEVAVGSSIQSLAAPGMGTGIGEVSPSRAARHMRIAYDSIVDKNRGRKRNVGQIWGEHQELLSHE
jgi:O-acetyl-ADP-ribose deacetylase (regulator of RNase III)